MTVLVITLLLATAVTAVAWWCFAERQPPKEAEEDETLVRQRCRRQAQMRNFWAYDGTEQTDVEELAEALYRKRKEQ